MQTANKYIVILILSLTIVGCTSSESKQGKPLAKVYDKSLYASDIEGLFPSGASKEDSLQLLNSYVDRWVRKQLMLYRAERNLTEEQKNVTQQLEDYRSSLLIFKYEQEFIRQKLDTVIPYEELEAFYKDNSSNFLLAEGIVKALFIKIRLDDPYFEKIRAIYKSTKEEDVKNLDKMAYQVAVKYDYFNDTWIPFSRILREFPEPLANPDAFLLANKSLEMKDDIYVYLLLIRDVAHKGQLSPLEFELQNIQSILINKRKQRLIIDLETKLYNDARNHNLFTVYLE